MPKILGMELKKKELIIGGVIALVLIINMILIAYAMNRLSDMERRQRQIDEAGQNYDEVPLPDLMREQMKNDEKAPSTDTEPAKDPN